MVANTSINADDEDDDGICHFQSQGVKDCQLNASSSQNMHKNGLIMVNPRQEGDLVKIPSEPLNEFSLHSIRQVAFSIFLSNNNREQLLKCFGDSSQAMVHSISEVYFGQPKQYLNP